MALAASWRERAGVVVEVMMSATSRPPDRFAIDGEVPAARAPPATASSRRQNTLGLGGDPLPTDEFTVVRGDPDQADVDE